jgi:7-cyano-7-deazaguanine reductase
MDKLSDTSGLKALGSQGTKYAYEGADKTLLESFPNPMLRITEEHPVVDSMIEITAPEFTSLCPLTGQPDFATIVVEYEPRDLCVESKAFKLYLGSFRNTGEFHEACVARIHNDLWELLNPLYLKVQGQFTPRGGIKFWPCIIRYEEPK